jgi:hypothetical protein
VKIDIVAIIEDSSSKEYKQQRQQPELQQHFHHQQQQHHRHFLPITDDNIYNCEVCGVRIALLQIVTDTPNGQEQFKACRTCLEEYIDQVAAKE